MNITKLIEDRVAEYRLKRIAWHQQVKDNAYRECKRLLVLFIANTKLTNCPQLERALARYQSK